MAFYHWLGPAVKGWTSGKKEKEEHDLESSLKRIKMQQLADSMMMDKTRFGQEQKGWATEDAENARKLRRLADGGYLDQVDQTALETSLLEKDDKKFHNGRNQTEADQADSQFEDEETKRLYETMSKKAEGENAAERERLELLKLQKEINNIGAIRTGTGTPKVPPTKPTKPTTEMLRRWNMVQKIREDIANSGDPDKYLQKNPGLAAAFTGEAGIPAQEGYFGFDVLGGKKAVPSTRQLQEEKLAEIYGWDNYVPRSQHEAAANVDADIANMASKIEEGKGKRPGLLYGNNGPQSQPQPQPQPQPQSQPQSQPGVPDQLSALVQQYAGQIQWTPEENQRFQMLVSAGVPEDQARMIIVNERVNPTKSSGSVGDFFRGAADVLTTPPKPMGFGRSR